MGFLTGTEMDWFPEAVRLLRDELPNIDVIISSQTSPELAGALLRGKVDMAFLRPEERMPDLAFKLLTKEPLVVVLPSDHRLAALKAIGPQDIAGETFISVSRTAPTLRGSGANSRHEQTILASLRDVQARSTAFQTAGAARP
jgi:LysR family hca operon transcriptional activator